MIKEIEKQIKKISNFLGVYLSDQMKLYQENGTLKIDKIEKKSGDVVFEFSNKTPTSECHFDISREDARTIAYKIIENIGEDLERQDAHMIRVLRDENHILAKKRTDATAELRKLKCKVNDMEKDIAKVERLEEISTNLSLMKSHVNWWKKACKKAGPPEKELDMALTYHGPGYQLVRSMALEFKRLREMVAPWEDES
jgi:hypothetical protein